MRRTRITVAAALITVAAALVIAQDSAFAAGGSKDCTGIGEVSISGEFKWASGFRVDVKTGAPTSPTWGKRVDPGRNLYPQQWTLVSPYASGNWGASVVDDRYGRLGRCESAVLSQNCSNDSLVGDALPYGP